MLFANKISFPYIIFMKNEGSETENNVDRQFGKAAYHVVMFLVEHFRIVKEELNIDYESFIILQVINSHYLYNKTKEGDITWSDNWKNIESNEAKKTLRKKRLSILAISEILRLPQETTRRKIQKLIEMKILIKDSSSGIIYDERFVNFHKVYSTKFAKIVANFILSLNESDKDFFRNLSKLD